MFDTIDDRMKQDDPHSWKDWASRGLMAVVVVAILVGGIYLSVSGS